MSSVSDIRRAKDSIDLHSSRAHLITSVSMTSCRHDSGFLVPLDNLENKSALTCVNKVDFTSGFRTKVPNLPRGESVSHITCTQPMAPRALNQVFDNITPTLADHHKGDDFHSGRNNLQQALGLRVLLIESV